MAFILLLTIAPILFGFSALVLSSFKPRRFVVVAGAAVQGALAVAFAAWASSRLPVSWDFESRWLGSALLAGELAMAAFVAIKSVTGKRPVTLLLAVLQATLAILFEPAVGEARVSSAFRVDQLGLIMALLVGVVGGLILFYAAGYMKTYHADHPGVKDRRRSFSFLLLAFLGCMYGLSFANDLRIALFFWEATTLASFVLIGYAGDPESKRNSFKALTLNLLGGVGFQLAIAVTASRTGDVGLDALLGWAAVDPAAAAVPVAFLALAGLVKSAQLPFTPWLLGAMVAPTPVSALLHSSTMVKAGSYLLLRLAPALAGTTTGYMVAFIGILTFIAGAFAAVSRRNAKRVLALSTVSNLGLIAACAGVGGYQLAWVAVFLLLFHAAAKALLFLAVGSASSATGSLDIEDMAGLSKRMPRVALLMTIGISAMFVAPFGMLVSKWAAMEAFIKLHSIVSPVMIVLIAFGSATTVMFWTKWLGVLIRTPDPRAESGALEGKTSVPEYVAETALALLAIALCATIPLVSKTAVEPYLLLTYGRTFGLGRGNAVLMMMMVATTVLLPALLILISSRRRTALSSPYLSGRNQSPGLGFGGSMGLERTVETRAYYLGSLFNEAKILNGGLALGGLLVIAMLGTVLL